MAHRSANPLIGLSDQIRLDVYLFISLSASLFISPSAGVSVYTVGVAIIVVVFSVCYIVSRRSTVDPVSVRFAHAFRCHPIPAAPRTGSSTVTTTGHRGSRWYHRAETSEDDETCQGLLATAAPSAVVAVSFAAISLASI